MYDYYSADTLVVAIGSRKHKLPMIQININLSFTSLHFLWHRVRFVERRLRIKLLKKLFYSKRPIVTWTSLNDVRFSNIILMVSLFSHQIYNLFYSPYNSYVKFCHMTLDENFPTFILKSIFISYKFLASLFKYQRIFISLSRFTSSSLYILYSIIWGWCKIGNRFGCAMV